MATFDYLAEVQEDGSVNYTLRKKAADIFAPYPTKNREIPRYLIREDENTMRTESLDKFIQEKIRTFDTLLWIDGTPYYQVDDGLLAKCTTHYDYHICIIARSIAEEQDLPFKGWKWPQDLDKEEVSSMNLDSFLKRTNMEVVDHRD